MDTSTSKGKHSPSQIGIWASLNLQASINPGVVFRWYIAPRQQVKCARSRVNECNRLLSTVTSGLLVIPVVNRETCRWLVDNPSHSYKKRADPKNRQIAAKTKVAKGVGATEPG